MTRVPKPLTALAGVLIGFFGCCAAGRIVAARNIYGDEVMRFHLFLSPETSYYPTANQLLRLAEARLPEDRIGVIVGGSSVLHGVGQRQEHLWSRRLQDLLGDRFRVVNFAFRAGSAHEDGNWVAENLLRRKRHIVYIADFYPCYGLMNDPSGFRSQYFYWDARYKGLIEDFPERERLMKDWETRHAQSQPYTEMRRRMLLDSWFYFSDLWTTVHYNWFGTFYLRLTGDRWALARRLFADQEPQTPPGLERYARYEVEHEVQFSRDFGRPCEGSARETMERAFRAGFSPQVSRSMVAILDYNSPYYLRRLTPRELLGLKTSTRVTMDSLEKLGAMAIEVGENWDELDFHDRVHVAEPGGQKMAAAVADAVLKKSRQLYGE
jgi:hypothetical protein